MLELIISLLLSFGVISTPEQHTEASSEVQATHMAIIGDYIEEI